MSFWKILGKIVSAVNEIETEKTYEEDLAGYKKINDAREAIRLDYQNPSRESKLRMYDEQLRRYGNPMRRKAESMSDEELDAEIEKNSNVELILDTILKLYKKLPFEEIKQKKDYIEAHDNHELYVAYKNEKYKRSNEGKKRYREHGWYLPNDDD